MPETLPIRSPCWRLACVGLSITALSGCSQDPGAIRWQEPTLAAVQPAEPVRFRFAWPVPGSVRVTERTDKHGHVVTATYDFVLSPGTQAGQIVGRFEQYSFQNINGQSWPQLKAADREALQATIDSIPAVRIGADGSFLGVDDLAGFLAEMERMKGPSRAWDMLRENAQARRAFEQQAGRFWRSWVQMWAGWEAAPGMKGTGERAPAASELLAGLGIGSGGISAAPAEFVFHGFVAVPATHAHVSFTFHADLEAQALAQMTKAFGVSNEKVPAATGRATQKMSAVVDPATLRPASAFWEERIEVTIGSESHTRLERREYTFVW